VYVFRSWEPLVCGPYEYTPGDRLSRSRIPWFLRGMTIGLGIRNYTGRPSANTDLPDMGIWALDGSTNMHSRVAHDPASLEIFDDVDCPSSRSPR